MIIVKRIIWCPHKIGVRLRFDSLDKIKIESALSIFILCPHKESNLDQLIKSQLLYH